MIRNVLFATTAFLIALPLAAADLPWTQIGPGVAYREFKGEHTDVYVARVDLTNPDIEVVSTPQSYRGTTVSDFGQKMKALVAINGDYFDPQFNPRGLMINPCDQWTGAKGNPLNEAILAVADHGASIQSRATFDPIVFPVATAISGWPVLVKSCRAFSSAELPGSDAFTRTPLPRTAVGISKDGTILYLVVVDGRRTGVPGLTLADLGRFMTDELEVCSAVNLDGGGSSTMWAGALMNRPSDGVERRVGDHLAVILRSDAVCPPPPAEQTASTTTVTTKVTTTTVTTTTEPMSSSATAPPATTTTTAPAPPTTAPPTTTTAPPPPM